LSSAILPVLAQIFEHLGAEILVELANLQFGLADLAARLHSRFSWDKDNVQPRPCCDPWGRDDGIR